MNQQPDKLFREKLEDYQTPPPLSAWNKVESRLAKKNNGGLWWKIAASLTLLAIATYLLWPKGETQTQQVSQNVNEHKIVVPEKDNKNSIEENKTALPIEENQPVAIVKKETSKKTNRPTKEGLKYSEEAQSISSQDIEAQHVEPSLVLEESQTIAEASVTENTESLPIISETSNTSAIQTQNESNSITIVYSAEEVNEKYLDKNTMAQATPEEKKPSTLKMLLNKAYALKHDQDPFGGLRQKKNEILALNFKKDKRSQNK